MNFLYNGDTITFPMSIAGSYTFASLTALQTSSTAYTSYVQTCTFWTFRCLGFF